MLAELCRKYAARKLDSSFAMHFLNVYETHFAAIRMSKLEILEIGVQKGGSLRMWAEYFPNSNITGVDITKKCKRHEAERIRVILGDQADEAFLNTLGRFDIVVDDGGHTMIQQQTSFRVLWEHLNPGGFYVIEDLETSYWPKFGGAYGKRDTTIEMLKCCVDNLNHAAPSHDRAEIARMTIRNYGFSAIHFYPSLCILCKEKQ